MPKMKTFALSGVMPGTKVHAHVEAPNLSAARRKASKAQWWFDDDQPDAKVTLVDAQEVSAS